MSRLPLFTELAWRGFGLRLRPDLSLEVSSSHLYRQKPHDSIRRRRTEIVTALQTEPAEVGTVLSLFPGSVDCSAACTWLTEQLAEAPQPIARLVRHWCMPAEGRRDVEKIRSEELLLAAQSLGLIGYLGERERSHWRRPDQVPPVVWKDPPPRSSRDVRPPRRQGKEKLSSMPEIWKNWPLSADLGAGTVAFANAYPGPCPECKATVWWTCAEWELLVCGGCCPPGEAEEAEGVTWYVPR